MNATLDSARDAAQQAVTAVLHCDRATAVDIVSEFPHPEVLSLVLLDLVAYVHRSWANVLGMTATDARLAWAEMMTDIEEWRSEAGTA